MLRRALPLLTTRTNGYVFWRQKTIVELEKTKRSYLLHEQPYPIAEIARRMARVKTAYRNTTDTHEQHLLRGEYKYFMGKLLDLRKAAVTDLIAFVENAAFFGFWDSAQLSQVTEELHLRLSELTANELVHLLLALAGARKHRSKLYDAVASELQDVVADLDIDDVIRIVKVLEAEDPEELSSSLLLRLSQDVDRVTAADAADLLSALAVLSPEARGRGEPQRAVSDDSFAPLLVSLTTTATSEHSLPSLTPLQIASLFHALEVTNGGGAWNRELRLRLQQEFLQRLPEACPPSLATMCYATQSIEFARAAEHRVLHLLPRFSTGELYGVLSVYLDALVTVQKAAVPTSASGGGEVEALPLAPEERVLLQQRILDLSAVVTELTEQLLLHLSASSVYVPPETLLGFVEIYTRCYVAVKQVNREATGVESVCRRAVHALSSRVISSCSSMDLSQLVGFLTAANALGVAALHASVFAVLDRLKAVLASSSGPMVGCGVRESQWLPSGLAVEYYNALHLLSNLSRPHRTKLEAEVLPLLRKRVAQEDAEQLQ